MKFKLMPMLAGLISLTVVTTPFIAKAQDSGSESLPQTTQQTQRHSPFANLNLTQQQQDQLAQIKSDTQARINQVLTSDQQAQLQNARQSGEKPWQAFKSLNLSPQQKDQIKQIRQSSRQQMKAVLTPEQQQQMQARMQQWRQQRQEQHSQPEQNQ